MTQPPAFPLWHHFDGSTSRLRVDPIAHIVETRALGFDPIHSQETRELAWDLIDAMEHSGWFDEDEAMGDVEGLHRVGLHDLAIERALQHLDDLQVAVSSPVAAAASAWLAGAEPAQRPWLELAAIVARLHSRPPSPR